MNKSVAFLSFVAAILVVMLHMAVSAVRPFDGLLWWWQEFSSQGVCRVAVPWFFVVSGFYLFRKYTINGDMLSVIKTWVTELRKRVRTIIVPYLMWIIVGFTFTCIYALSSSRVEMPHIDLCSLRWWLLYLGISNYPPTAPHLWFLRSLMIGVVISPVLFIMMRRYPRLCGLLAVIASVIGVGGGVCLMALGGFLAIHDFKKRVSLGWAVPFWLILCVIKCVLVFNGFNMPCYAMNIMNLIGLIAFWSLGKWAVTRFDIPAANVFQASMFFYMAHTYILFSIGTLLTKVCGINVVTMIHYIIKLVVSLFFLLFLWRWLGLHAAGVLSVMDGGRSKVSGSDINNKKG